MSMDKHELPFIQDMFEAIAHRYDFLNRALSLRQDMMWRNKLVQTLDVSNNENILDVASGTGDVALAINKQYPSVHIHCVDFSVNMLRFANQKKMTSHHSNLFIACADAFELPYPTDYFHAATMAFGIRNIVKKQKLLHTLYQHLVPGGQLLILELTVPEMKVLQNLYLLYFKKLLPMIGRMVSKNSFAYDYLPDSVVSFPSSLAFSQMMNKAGFIEVKWLPMTSGICTLFFGRRPQLTR
jgi:demethylmenaquinone methyltransferase/2-methoxy-6-polyprenyl-1,4-benzoquinol methylase